MLSSLQLILIIAPLLTLVSFVSQRSHVLICLLSLEATVLSLAFAITYFAAQSSQVDLFYCIIILSFGACEAALALGVLVVIARAFGRDIIRSVNLNKC